MDTLSFLVYETQKRFAVFLKSDETFKILRFAQNDRRRVIVIAGTAYIVRYDEKVSFHSISAKSSSVPKTYPSLFHVVISSSNISALVFDVLCNSTTAPS